MKPEGRQDGSFGATFLEKTQAADPTRTGPDELVDGLVMKYLRGSLGAPLLKMCYDTEDPW